VSPTPKIPVAGELWLNADGFPQLTILLPEGRKLWVQIRSKDTEGNSRSSKAYKAAMEALGIDEVAGP
jgi:hypothetical protein